jgi:hypothetical protein
MPELIGNLLYTGTLDNLTMYKMRGCREVCGARVLAMA